MLGINLCDNITVQVGQQFVRLFACTGLQRMTLLHLCTDQPHAQRNPLPSPSLALAHISPPVPNIIVKLKKNNTNLQDHNISSRTELNFSNGFFGLRGRNNNSEIHPNDSSKTQQGLRIL